MSVFEVSRGLGLFDEFRVPYTIAPATSTAPRLPADPLLRSCAWARTTVETGVEPRFVFWPANGHDGASGTRATVGSYLLEGTPLFGRVLADEHVQRALEADGGTWSRHLTITARNGEAAGSVWRDDRGNVFLPFEPDEIVGNLQSERYLTVGDGRGRGIRLGRVARGTYYRVRPLLPRRTQIALRRAFARVQQRVSFPRWPAEPALHDFCELVMQLFADVAGVPLPWIAPWPDGHTWALILTHDVETSAGVRQLGLMKDLELAEGYRSSWNFVPQRYVTEDSLVAELKGQGFEVGVHGLRHDGRDLESLQTLQERLPAIRAYAERWDAKGFRSPATQRVFELMPLLDFDYDSSYPDTDPYEPQSGGCCSWLPFFNRDLVELPVTLPQDHTLFVILRHTDETAWVEKAESLRARGGMALLITHPDYMIGERLAVYRRFLARYSSDATVWRALPRDVAAWWRRRAASGLTWSGDRWTATGPAAGEAVIRYVMPGPRADEPRPLVASAAAVEAG